MYASAHDPKPMTRLTSTCGTKQIGTQLSTSRQACQGSTSHIVWHTMSDQQARTSTLVIREVVQTCMHQHTAIRLLESNLYDPKPMTTLTNTCGTKQIGTQLSTNRQACQGSTDHTCWKPISFFEVHSVGKLIFFGGWLQTIFRPVSNSHMVFKSRSPLPSPSHIVGQMSVILGGAPCFGYCSCWAMVTCACGNQSNGKSSVSGK